MGPHAILLVLVCYHLLFHDRVQCNWDLSRKEYFDIDKQLELLNKSPMKTIVSKYGDIYDCVDFYKQPAFDHPLLKNQTFDLQVKNKTLYNTTREAERQACPVGSVPIRRITDVDLVRERNAYKDRRMETTNRSGAYLAIAKTHRGDGEYAGAKCSMSINNPKASGHQYSATRIKLQSGPNSVEAGWRVDPTLYGDSKTHFFVRTDAGTSHCFNTRCPGFVHTSREYPIDFVFTKISVPGADKPYDEEYQIIRDNGNGNWNLLFGMESHQMGFWPSHILPGPVNIEWGGAAYSPPGSPLPQMGSGNFPIGKPRYDSYISKLEIVDENGQISYAQDIETYAEDSTLYSVLDVGYEDDHWGRLIAYGGPGNGKS